MTTYKITGYGSKTGSIGYYRQNFELTIKAKDRNDLIEQLYHQYEHISNLKIEEQKEK